MRFALILLVVALAGCGGSAPVDNPNAGYYGGTLGSTSMRVAIYGTNKMLLTLNGTTYEGYVDVNGVVSGPFDGKVSVIGGKLVGYITVGDTTYNVNLSATKS